MPKSVSPSLEPQDPGLQPERTRMAWWRTVLAALVADFFIWRAWINSMGHGTTGIGLSVAGVLALVLTLGLVAVASYRTRALKGRGLDTVAPPWTMLATTCTLGGIAALAVLAVVLH